MDWSKKHLRQTRILQCPDDIPRAVTLKNWYWYHFDWLIENGHSTYERLIRIAYLGALDGEDFEYGFRAVLEDYILKKMQSIDPSIFVVSNEYWDR